MKTLTFSAAIEASDAGRRIISGKIVPFNGEVGHTSVGPVIFEQGAIQIPNVSKIKLLAQHEKNNPIGRMQNFQESSDGIYASFKVSASTKGQDFLIMASEGLIDGLSVGVEVIASKERKDGTLVVSAARLQEVSLVESPAFDNARVLDVAAEAAEEVSEPVEVSEEPETLNESEATVSEDTTAATTEAAAAPVAAEASRPTIKASQPYISTSVRHGIDSMGRYVENKIKASQGDLDARDWIAAAEDPTVVRAAADSIGTTNPAFNPIQYMKELYVNNRFGAPARDAVSRGVLPTSGMTFQIPSLVTSAGGGSGVAPTVAATSEAGTPSNTGMETQYITGTVSKYAGQQTITLELLERSNPVFFDELAKQMELAYLKSIDAAILTGLLAGTTGTKNYSADSAGIIDFVSTESALAYAGTSAFAKNYLCGTSQWSLLMGAVDTTGRPIYNAVNPWNAAGESNPGAIKGNVLGLDLYVDYQAVNTTIDNSAFIIVPEAVTWYESPTSYFSVNNVSNMEVQTAIYGYGSLVVKNAKGIRKFDVA
jgi:HK97 family phage prohead protease/HK97 family phage major capsid protein